MADITKQDLLDWQEAKANLDKAKKVELELRNKICSPILTGTMKGAVHFMKFGLDATATAKLTDKLDKDVYEAIEHKLSGAEKECIKTSYSLVAAEYKELPKDSILHSAVTSTPGTPSLTVKPIKKES